MVTGKHLDPSGGTYNLMNVVGVIGIATNVYKQKAWPALCLQIAWGIIGIIALIRLWL